MTEAERKTARRENCVFGLEGNIEPGMMEQFLTDRVYKFLGWN